MELNKEILEEKNNDNAKGILEVDLNHEMKDSFLSYAMSVIVSRALPDVRDGMKPVHRRILFAMHQLGNYSDRPHKKSARIVGDVIGKYHPHGDTAVYEAMVRMAQNFSYRYPLVDGHGNFGSVDGDPAAAMRYTEARMSKLTAELLRDLDKNTVDFVDNYDGSEQEPAILPCRYPNLLVNGTSGIAVGMATNIPPHNLGETVNAILALIKNPMITCEGLLDYISAPDFPTGGIIMGTQQVRNAYLSGVGTVTVRAKTEVIKLKNNKQEIIIKEIPYQVNKTRLLERIAEIANNKIIEGVTDLRDESTRKGIKVVIELKKDANANVILNNLFKHTQMQTTYGINMLALDKGQPKVFNLKEMLSCYLEHQVEVVTRRTEFDLEKAKARLHIVNGLLIALASIDEVIAIIKASATPDIASKELTNKFLLSEIQAKAILDMRLQTLTGLQVSKLEEEKQKLTDLVEELESILKNHTKKMQIISDELIEIKNKYGDDRRTEIDLSSETDVNDEDLINVEDVIVTITNKGYIKRLSVDSYRAQKRGGKGVTGTKMQSDDFVERMLYTSSHDNILFFTNLGKVFILKAYQIPNASRISKGLPLVNLLSFEENEKLAAVVNCSSVEQGGYLIFATKTGTIKKTELIQYKNIRSTGIRAITLNEGDELMDVSLTDGTKEIILGASNGKAVRFNESLVRSSKRAAAGVSGIKVAEGEKLIGMCVVNAENDEIMIVTSNGFGKRTMVESFKSKGRNGKGVKFMNLTSKNGIPVCMKPVSGDDDLMVITDKGMVVRTHLDQISTIGRDTQGVRVVSLYPGHSVASIAIIPRNNDDEEEIEDIKNEFEDYEIQNSDDEIQIQNDDVNDEFFKE